MERKTIYLSTGESYGAILKWIVHYCVKENYAMLDQSLLDFFFKDYMCST